MEICSAMVVVVTAEVLSLRIAQRVDAARHGKTRGGIDLRISQDLVAAGADLTP